MKNLNSHQDALDPALEGLLAQLRPVPERDPQAEAQGLARFTAELETLEGDPVPPVVALPGRAPTFIDKLKENYAMLTRKPALVGVLTIVLIFVFLFGGTGITASAAQASLPGDALYPLKTGIEMTQANLEGDLGLRAQLYTGFAQRRLEEISSLIDSGRYEDIPAATSEFEEYIQKALQALSELAQSDAQRALALNSEITELISQLTAELSGLLAQVPAPADVGVESTTPTTETGADDANSNNANGNDVNGNDANVNDANANDANSNDANSNGAAVNDDNGNDDNANDANINDDNGNGSDDDRNGNDDNSNGTSINDDDDGNNANINDDDNGNDDDGSSGSGSGDDSGSGSGGGDDNSGSGGSGSGSDDNSGSGGSDDGGNSGSGGGNDDD